MNMVQAFKTFLHPLQKKQGKPQKEQGKQCNFGYEQGPSHPLQLDGLQQINAESGCPFSSFSRSQYPGRGRKKTAVPFQQMDFKDSIGLVLNLGLVFFQKEKKGFGGIHTLGQLEA